MRISTRGRYGLRAMFELARRFPEGPVLMSTIAETQGLSRKHLHALLTALKSAGLVRSIRGPGGGFMLSRSPAQIKLSEIIHALEGPFSVVHCVSDRRVCNRADRCPARGVWRKLSKAIEEVLDNVTLDEMTAPRRRRRLETAGRSRARGSTGRRGLCAQRSGIAPRRRTAKAGKR